MEKIKLKGKVPFNRFIKGTKPEFYMLLKPSKVHTSFDEASLNTIEKNKMDIKWEATWRGKRLCKKVVDRSKNYYEYLIHIQNIFKKLEPYFKDSPEQLKSLKFLERSNMRDINGMKKIVDSIDEQVKLFQE